MKGLTLIRPWELTLAPPGPKPIENRSWRPPDSLLKRGERFALHAGQKFDSRAAEWIRSIWPELRATRSVPGVITAVATLDDVHEFRSCAAPGESHMHCSVCRSQWAFGRWCWVLRDRIALPEPVPCRGAQGLWDLPVDVAAAVLAQLETRQVREHSR